jgi:hypothetical protein
LAAGGSLGIGKAPASESGRYNAKDRKRQGQLGGLVLLNGE